MTSGSVRRRVRELIETTELSDPHQIADAILTEMRGQAAKEALAECLPQYVRLVITSDRGRSRLDSAANAADAQPLNAGSSRSSKWAAARSLFRDPIAVAAEWRQFGDLTVDDVSWLVDDRDRQAKDLMQARDRFEALRDLMIRRKAKRVRDLPEADVREVLS